MSSLPAIEHLHQLRNELAFELTNSSALGSSLAPLASAALAARGLVPAPPPRRSAEEIVAAIGEVERQIQRLEAEAEKPAVVLAKQAKKRSKTERANEVMVLECDRVAREGTAADKLALAKFTKLDWVRFVSEKLGEKVSPTTIQNCPKFQEIQQQKAGAKTDKVRREERQHIDEIDIDEIDARSGQTDAGH